MTEKQSCAEYFKGEWNELTKTCSKIPKNKLFDVTTINIFRNDPLLRIEIGTEHVVLPRHGLVHTTTVNTKTMHRVLALPHQWIRNDDGLLGSSYRSCTVINAQIDLPKNTRHIFNSMQNREWCFFDRTDRAKVAKKIGW